MIPEDYRELENYLNHLNDWLWKKILAAKNFSEVNQLLRKHCPELRGWTDEDLSEFFSQNPPECFSPVYDCQRRGLLEEAAR